MEKYIEDWQIRQAMIEEVATSINEGKIKNLADVDWGSVTDWHTCNVESIVGKINDRAVKVAVIDCILEKWRIHCTCFMPRGEVGFGDYCTRLQTHINHYALYDIESIKTRENQQITELQKDVATLQKDVAELKNSRVPHFNSPQNSGQQTRVFQALKKGGYFDTNAKLDMWLYVCGGAALNGEFEPLNWIRDNGLLVHLIVSLFTNDINLWSTAQRCFKVKGATPNTNTLKRLNCQGYSNKNKRHNELEALLMCAIKEE